MEAPVGLADLVQRGLDRTPRLTPEEIQRAKPVRNPAVTEETLEDGTVLLRAPLAQQGRGIMATIARWAKAPDTKGFELESVGAFVWALCDGRNTVEAISKKLRAEYKMNRLEADASLNSFLQMLSQRRLITLMVGKRK